MEHYNNPFEPINLLVVVRKAPRLVVPALETPNNVLHISTENACMAFGSVLSSHMLLFEASQPIHEQYSKLGHLPTSHGLARSLERVLVAYYPLAGRLRPGLTPTQLQLACNAQGAIYVDAQANISLAELKKLDKVYWSDLQYDFVPHASAEIPPLIIQVTTLTCGGFVVSIRVLQALCDASGMLHFLHAWSELTKFDKNYSVLATPIWGGIIPTKTSQRPLKLHYPSLEMTHFNAIETTNLKHLEVPPIVRYEHGSMLGLANISVRIEELINLKDTINVKCNKFEALVALFWREHVRALNLPSSMDVELFFPAPVPHDTHLAFYGQYAFNCMVTEQVGNLLQADLTKIVQLLHHAKMHLDDNSFVSCVKEFGRLHGTSRRAPPPQVLLFTLLWEGVSEVDFGFATSPYVPDAVRLHSPINGIAITGGLEDTIELVMTNVPGSIITNIHHHLHRTGHFQNFDNNTSKL